MSEAAATAPRAELLRALGIVMDRMSALPTDKTNYRRQSYTSVDGIRAELHRRLREVGCIFGASHEPPVVTPEGLTVYCRFTITHENGADMSWDASGRVVYDGKVKPALTDVLAASSLAFRNWAINTLLLTFEDQPSDDDGENFPRQAVQDAFDELLKGLKSAEPEKGAAETLVKEIMAKYKTGSGRPVADASEFRRKKDADSAWQVLEIRRRKWNKEKFERRAGSDVLDNLEVTPDDIPAGPAPLKSYAFGEHGSTVIGYIKAKHDAKDPAGWLAKYDPAGKDQLLAEALEWAKGGRRG